MPRKILLADDSVTAQNMGKKILSDAGYEVIAVSNGSAALKKAYELLPDIAVLDVYMPGYSGLEVCKQLKENAKTAHIPILLTVGKLEPFKSEEALKAKANAFIVKPFEATELLAVIRKIEDAISKVEQKSSKTTAKASSPSRMYDFSDPAEVPDPEQSRFEEGGWKNRLSIPRVRVAEPASEEDAPAMGTGFRDLTPAPAEESGLRRESAFTADPVVAQAPEAVAKAATTEASLDISVTPEEIAAIRAAVEILSGEGDNAPVLHVVAAQVDGMPRRLAPEPEEPVADWSTEKIQEAAPVSEVPKNATEKVTTEVVTEAAAKETAPSERAIAIAAVKEPEISTTAAASTSQNSALHITPSQISASQPNRPRWKAEAVELTSKEAEVSLEREMREALGSVSAAASVAKNSEQTFNPESLRGSTENTAVTPMAVPVQETPAPPEAAQIAAQAEPAAVLAVAASATGDSHRNSVSTSATTMAENQSTAVAATVEVPAATALPAIAPAPASIGFQDLRPVKSPDVAAPGVVHDVPHGAPNIDPSAPEDEIDSRTKSQMDAAWSNWRDIRNSIVTPKLTEQLAEVAAAAAQEGNGGQAANSESDAHDASSIGSIVDSVLAEMRPKLVEEIARKLAAKKQ